MPVEQLKKIADEADMIVAGYAFTKNAEGLIQVLNLSNPEEACVLQKDGRNNNGYDYCFKSAGLLLEKQGIYGGRGCLSIFHLKLPDIICIIQWSV